MTPAHQKETTGSGHEVHIEVNGQAFTYTRKDGSNADKLIVRQGDHITWHCAHGNYSVLFKHNSPFHEIAFHGKRGDVSGSAIVVGPEGSYHYGVTVALNGALIVDDPEVIVDNAGN